MEEQPNIQTLTCIFCGMQYPMGTPPHGDQVLIDHIRVCDKHPLRKAEDDIKILRSALVALIASDNDEELKSMKHAVRMIGGDGAPIAITGIDALLATSNRRG